MKLIKTTLAALAIAGAASNASAIVYTYNTDPVQFVSAGSSYSNTLNFGTDLTNWAIANSLSPATHYIASAVVEFAFSDSEGDPNSGDSGLEYFSVYAYGKLLQIENGEGPLSSDSDADIEGSTGSSAEVDGTHGAGYDYREAVIEGSEYDDLATGQLNYTVKSVGGSSGDAYLKKVNLKIEILEKPTASVPDSGASISLLGFALLGLAAARRKFSK